MKKTLLTLMMPVLACLGSMGQDLKVWMDNPVMVADGKTVTYLHIYQTDANNKQYWNFQVEIKLPAGIHIAKRKEGRKEVNDAVLNETRFEGLPHVLGVNMPDATTFKSLCGNSASKEPYYNDDIDGNIVEELFRVGLVADPEMQNGEYTISMYKAIFVDTLVNDFRIEEPVEATMTITGGQGAEGEVIYTLGDSGYGTLILPYEANTPEGVQAYTCTGLDGNTVLMESQDCIPANTPVVVHGTPGTYTFAGTSTATETEYTVGLLTGVLEATEISDGYVLQQHGGEVGFYVVDPTAPRTVPANRCYLSVPSGVKSLRLGVDDDADGIAMPEWVVDTDESVVFDLSGRKVSKGTKGIVITKGRKETR